MTGDKFAITYSEGNGREYDLKLDSDEKIKTLDLSMGSGDLARKELGIYKWEDDDTITLCIDDSGAKRPAEFATQKGTTLELFTLKRIKP